MLFGIPLFLNTMRPSKSRVYCLASRKLKLSFETKQKADNFLKFNASEILSEKGKAPVRSYYCQLCCAWHVTSNPSEASSSFLDSRDGKLVDYYLHDSEVVRDELKRLSLQIRGRMNLIDEAIDRNDLPLAQRLLRLSMNDLNRMKHLNPRSFLILRPQRQLEKRKLKIDRCG